jgi:hypothetical protein
VMYNTCACIAVYYGKIGSTSICLQGTVGGKRRWLKFEQLSLRLQTTSSGGEWLLAWVPQNGDRDGVSICPEGDQAGRAREVPQEN